MDRGTWGATVHGIAKSQTRLKQLGTAQHSTQHFSALPEVSCPYAEMGPQCWLGAPNPQFSSLPELQYLTTWN